MTKPNEYEAALIFLLSLSREELDYSSYIEETIMKLVIHIDNDMYWRRKKGGNDM